MLLCRYGESMVEYADVCSQHCWKATGPSNPSVPIDTVCQYSFFEKSSPSSYPTRSSDPVRSILIPISLVDNLPVTLDEFTYIALIFRHGSNRVPGVAVNILGESKFKRDSDAFAMIP